MNDKPKLYFYGGVETVTGANFLLEINNQKILVDCGLLQGENFCEGENCNKFEYDPKEIDFLIITHAHADHIGRIPQLVKEGFTGVIYSTVETKEIAEVMLEDALRFVLSDAEKLGVEPIYGALDIKNTFNNWEVEPYHQKITLKNEVSFSFKDAGHILGSAIVEIEQSGKKIVFTGDLGNSPAPFIKDTEDVVDAQYMVIESVYGDRNHEDVSSRKSELKEAIKGVIKKQGTLIIPAFSVSRTQIMLFELNSMVEQGELPSIPVFLDSPLAIKITEIYRKYKRNFNDTAHELIKSGDDIFDFPRLQFTKTVGESKEISDLDGPKIIIAGSGMSTGGRVIHHEKRYLSDSKNTLLIVGYQAPGGLGRLIQDGAREVLIEGKTIPVKAEIRTITGYSGHKDSDGLLEFVSKSASTLKKVFVVMGEPKSSLFLAQKIRDNLDIEAVVPTKGQSFELF